MAIIHKLIITMACGMSFTLSNAQHNMPSALDLLATQCKQVIELNDTINARQDRLDELKWLIEDLKQDWLRTCNEALSSAACDDNATRINTINELIQLTDPVFEAALLGQLKEAINNPEIRVLMPDGYSSSSPRRESAGKHNPGQKDKPIHPKQAVKPDPMSADGSSESDLTKKEDGYVVNPVTGERSKDDNPAKKDEQNPSPSSKESKKGNPERQVPPKKKEGSSGKDKSTIQEQKGQSNRNKTIELMNNKNKNQNK